MSAKPRGCSCRRHGCRSCNCRPLRSGAAWPVGLPSSAPPLCAPLTGARPAADVQRDVRRAAHHRLRVPDRVPTRAIRGAGAHRGPHGPRRRPPHDRPPHGRHDC
eukprot:2962767-Prymnesium_polylepis.2